MKLLDFYKVFPDESTCKEAFRLKRISDGIICRKCGNKAHYWKKKREQWECKCCHHRTTLKSGSVMENSKLPYLYWFIAMHFMTSTTKTFSAKEVQNQLGHNRYEPIWAMMHKIRAIMGIREEQYLLYNESEIDDGFYETVSKKHQGELQKRGRGSQKQTTVLVCAESMEVPLEFKNSKKFNTDKKLGFVKMKVINSLKKEEITSNIKEMIVEKSKLRSDGSNSYNELKEFYNHQPKVLKPKEASTYLPWVHTVISNSKRLFLDVYHRIDEDFLQNYLYEFTYKLNRRHIDDLFPRILTLATQHRWNYLGERYG